MTENAEESNSKLPLLSRHDFQSLIKDILLLENYLVEEKADTKAKEATDPKSSDDVFNRTKNRARWRY